MLVTYDMSLAALLEEIIKLETIYSSNSSIDDKLLQLKTLENEYNQILIFEKMMNDRRFAEILIDMICYYNKINQPASAEAPKIEDKPDHAGLIAGEKISKNRYEDIKRPKVQRSIPLARKKEIIKESIISFIQQEASLSLLYDILDPGNAQRALSILGVVMLKQDCQLPSLPNITYVLQFCHFMSQLDKRIASIPEGTDKRSIYATLYFQLNSIISTLGANSADELSNDNKSENKLNNEISNFNIPAFANEVKKVLSETLSNHKETLSEQRSMTFWAINAVSSFFNKDKSFPLIETAGVLLLTNFLSISENIALSGVNEENNNSEQPKI